MFHPVSRGNVNVGLLRDKSDKLDRNIVAPKEQNPFSIRIVLRPNLYDRYWIKRGSKFLIDKSLFPDLLKVR